MVIEKILKLEMQSGNIPLSVEQLTDSITIANVEYHGSRSKGHSWILTLQGTVTDSEYYYPYKLILLALTDTLNSSEEDQLSFLIEQVMPTFSSIKNVLLDTLIAMRKVESAFSE